MTILELVDELTYRNYAHNRRISPGVTPERWAKAYGPTSVAMEARYQAEFNELLAKEGVGPERAKTPAKVISIDRWRELEYQHFIAPNVEERE